MGHFTVRLGGLVEATCDNLAAALHKADTWAKRDREVYTVHRDDTLVATATASTPPCRPRRHGHADNNSTHHIYGPGQ